MKRVDDFLQKTTDTIPLRDYSDYVRGAGLFTMHALLHTPPGPQFQRLLKEVQRQAAEMHKLECQRC